MGFPLLLSLVVTAAGGFQGHAEERSFDRTERVRGLSRVVVKLKVATLKVVTDRSDDVNIRIVRKVSGGTADQRRWWLETPRYEVNNRNGRLTIEEILPEQHDDRDRWKNSDHFRMDVQAVLHVPARMDLDLSTGVGSIEASRTEGSLTAATGAGNVTLRDILNRNESVNVHTGAGNVSLAGRMGDLEVATGAGNIQANGVRCEGRNVNLQTGAGQIDADFDSVPSAKLSLQSGVGNVRLNLPGSSRTRIVSDSRERGGRDRNYGPKNLGGTLVSEVGSTRVSLSSGIGNLSLTTGRR